MNSEVQVRAADRIHMGDGKYLETRAIEMEWFGNDADDEMDTLAKLSFRVGSAEYAQLARLGLVDSDASTEETEVQTTLRLRTDRDLVDEAEETLAEEWHSSLEDASAELTVWNDLDYWEVESIE